MPPEAPLRALTSAEIETYDETGVVHAADLFPPHWLDRMEAAVDRIVREPTFFGQALSRQDEGFTGDLFLWKQDKDFHEWVFASPAARIAQQLLRTPKVRHFYDQLFVKQPGCHMPTPWHQDITFWPVELDSRALCSIWISFDDVTRESSGLEFVRGSHRWTERYKAVTPTYDPYMLASDFLDAPDIDAHRDDYDLFCPATKRGDCLIFNPVVLHGSSQNYSTEVSRRAFSTRWAGDDVRFESRSATMPLLWKHGLRDGQTLSGPLFPQVLPETIQGEAELEFRGPEPPDPENLRRFGEAVSKVASAGTQ